MIKKLLPKSLFTRFILIIIIPTVMAQIIATYIFYNRHWYNVNMHMTNSLIGEISTVINLREETPQKKIRSIVENGLSLHIIFYKDKHLPKVIKPAPELIENLSDELKNRVKYPLQIDLVDDENVIEILIETEGGLLEIRTSIKRVHNPTTYIFIMWMTGTSFFFFLLSIMFSRNQIRPIIKLAYAAEKFGKGQTIAHFKPTGALEVRKASNAFIIMQDRIERMITQRTEMLAGVSHDLRTPLTRMKLQLELAKDESIKDLKLDVADMEKMIESYLDFARGDTAEETTSFEFKDFLDSIISKYDGRVHVDKTTKISIEARQNALKRALVNIFNNATRYGDKAFIQYYKDEENLIINIEDDGIGIADKERKNVFKAFYRVEESRNKETAGVGLGLAITKDIINNHGGNIILKDSQKYGGLKVIITIPL